MFLKNGGWHGCGSFSIIAADYHLDGVGRIQIVSTTHQAAPDGSRRTRKYFSVRTAQDVVQLPIGVKTLKAAKAAVVDTLAASGASA